MVKAISTASVTIPAGETTWGAVFIINGLQLILAVLLMMLGLNIVFHSFSAYKKAEHSSETTSDSAIHNPVSMTNAADDAQSRQRRFVVAYFYM